MADCLPVLSTVNEVQSASWSCPLPLSGSATSVKEGGVVPVPATTVTEAPQVTKDEAEAILDGLKPPKRERPLIAVIGINDATETTDYLMPFEGGFITKW